MYFVEILESKSKQQNNKNFNKTAGSASINAIYREKWQPLLNVLQVIRNSILA